MRGKIACSAQRLSLLDPAMVQSVVEAQAYQVAHQYRSENRVRITDADERQISSVVIGNSGVYQVTVQLKDGALSTKCTCPLNNEQPLCRHSIAVLLEYHRWAQAKSAQQPAAKPVPVQAPPASNGRTSSALDIKLSEITRFVEWLQAAVPLVEQGHPFPSPPPLGEEALTWVRVLQSLDERRRASEERCAAMEADVRAHEAHLGRVTQQLQSCMEDTKAAQVACETLRREVAAYSAMQAKFVEIAKSFDGFDGQMKRIVGDVTKSVSQLDGLAGAFKETAAAVQSLTKKP
ncbi:SWIM zinc finger family protein [Candidatus Nitrospira bockiana]